MGFSGRNQTYWEGLRLKRINTLLGLLLLILLLAVFGQAAASPVLADQNTIAWIGEDNCLYVMDNSGNVLHLPMLVKDILSFSEDSVYCRMGNQQVYAIKRNCNGSQLVQSQTEGLLDNRYTLLNNQLTFGTVTIPQVEAAATDGLRMCAVTKSAGKYALVIYTTDGTTWTERSSTAFSLQDVAIPEPQSMILAQDNLVITGKDRSVWIGSFKTGKVQKLAASGNLTDAAAVINDTLYLYKADANQLWQIESSAALSADQTTVNRAASLPTAAPTAVPTATPKQQANPSPTATPEDDVIRLWSSGSRVRKMQQRLSALGYPVGSIDGVYGDDTRIAVNLFYDAIGYKEHDYLSSAARSKLYANNAPVYDPFLPLKKGTQSTSVLKMQQRLAQLGYDPGKLDGIYGKQTISALASFQEVSGLYYPEDNNKEPGEYASSDLLMHLFAENAPTRAPSSPLVQWQETANGWICYINGTQLTSGWRKIDKTWYYFSDTGIMQTGWIKNDNDWFYTNSKGAMLTGWQEINGNWYYFASNGKMHRGWFEDKQAEKKNKDKGQIWYWMDNDGKMVTGEHTINGKQEVFDQSGLWLYTR